MHLNRLACFLHHKAAGDDEFLAEFDDMDVDDDDAPLEDMDLDDFEKEVEDFAD